MAHSELYIYMIHIDTQERIGPSSRSFGPASGTRLFDIVRELTCAVDKVEFMKSECKIMNHTRWVHVHTCKHTCK